MPENNAVPAIAINIIPQMPQFIVSEVIIILWKPQGPGCQDIDGLAGGVVVEVDFKGVRVKKTIGAVLEGGQYLFDPADFDLPPRDYPGSFRWLLSNRKV